MIVVAVQRLRFYFLTDTPSALSRLPKIPHSLLLQGADSTTLGTNLGNTQISLFATQIGAFSKRFSHRVVAIFETVGIGKLGLIAGAQVQAVGVVRPLLSAKLATVFVNTRRVVGGVHVGQCNKWENIV